MHMSAVSTDNLIPINKEAELATLVDRLAEENAACLEALVASHQRLYQLLADIMRLAAMFGHDALRTLAKQRNLGVDNKSSGLRLAVKLVFQDSADRRRVSAYGIVLEKAEAEGILPDELAEWITEAGGVEAVRLSGKKRSARSRAGRIDIGLEVLTKRVAETTIQLDHLSPELADSDLGVLVVRRGPDDSWEVVLSHSSKRLIDAACEVAAELVSDGNEAGDAEAPADTSVELSSSSNGVIAHARRSSVNVTDEALWEALEWDPSAAAPESCGSSDTVSLAEKYALRAATKPSEYGFLNREQAEILGLYDNVSYTRPLLFWGPPGTGKTTLAKLLPRSLVTAAGYEHEPDIIFLNAPTEGKIEQIQSRITGHAPLYKLNWDRGFFVIDEADGLTEKSQDALKGLLDKYQHDNQFIFTTNHVERFSSALKDRCHLVNFPEPTRAQLLPFAKQIVAEELPGLKAPEELLKRSISPDANTGVSYRTFFANMELFLSRARRRRPALATVVSHDAEA